VIADKHPAASGRAEGSLPLLEVSIHQYGQSLLPFEHLLFYALIGSIAFAIFSAIAFTRISGWLIWCATLTLSALFIWYLWFMQGAPFVLHELHTFDPVEAAKEVDAFRTRSLIGTAIMLSFFGCLPVLHYFNRPRGSQR
jgi:hypothetical protein